MTAPARDIAAARAPRPMLALGQVRHERLRPAHNAFTYPTFFLMLPMRGLRERPDAALARNRRGLVSFHDADHGDGSADSLAWVEALLRDEGLLAQADGEIWLQCYPRVLGYAFKPVSFWWCERRDGTLAALVAEVHNTFGERHCYLLEGPSLGYGRDLLAQKVFHVSPFCAVQGRYRFRLMRTAGPEVSDDGARVVVRIAYEDDDGPLILTSMSGRLQPLTADSARAAFVRMPLLTLGVMARIHWQALRLWLRRVPFFTKPDPPAHAITRQAS